MEYIMSESKIKILIFNIKLQLARLLSRGAEKGIYYVNGPDTLPPPLSKEKEAE